MTVDLEGAVAIVTGGARGIGLALSERLSRAGARVAVGDLDGAAAAEVAARLPGSVGWAVDVTDERQVDDLVHRTESSLGSVDLYLSNAGVALGPELGSNDDWQRSFDVHVMAHVYAARAVLPGMVERGRGHFLVTASAAGLLSNIDSAPYTVTKHGSVALAEWLAINYGDSGVTFSCLCPQGVRTAMTAGHGADSGALAGALVLEPATVADAVLDALAAGRFLVLPHPEVAEFEQRRAGDRDRWLAAMRRLRARLRGAAQ